MMFIYFSIQLLCFTSFMIFGVFLCGKKSQPKHNLHILNYSQTKSAQSSKKSRSHHSRSRTRKNKSSHHSRSRSKHCNYYDDDDDRRHNNRKKKEKTEENGSEKMIQKQEIKIKPKEVEQIPDSDFPDIPDPTQTAKMRREKEIEREKKKRIKEGFYQERSDEDDTLEPIRSLKEEEITDNSNKKSNNNKKR